MFIKHEKQYIDIHKIESFTADPEHSPNLDLVMDSGRTHRFFYQRQAELIEAIEQIKKSREND